MLSMVCCGILVLLMSFLRLPKSSSYYNVFTALGTAVSRVFFRIVAKAVRMKRIWSDVFLQGLIRPQRSPSSSLSFAAFDLCR